MKLFHRIALSAVAVALVPFSGASAAADRTVDLAAGGSESWQGTDAPGINTNYHGNHDTDVAPVDEQVRTVQPTGTCTADPTTFCELTLVSLSNPVPDDDTDGKLSRRATFTVTEAKGDVDLRLYESDAEGTRGTFIAQSAGPLDTVDHTDLDETVEFNVVTTRPTLDRPTQPDVPTKYYLVEVVYYAAAGYTGGVQF